MITIDINKLHHPVTALGHGRRLGIWTQGCTVHCPGCVSLDTWESGPEWAVDVDEVLRWCSAALASDPELDGATISGGEPFDQAEGFTALLAGLRSLGAAYHRPFDLLAYSGRTITHLRRRHQPILDLLDAVVPEPYRDDLGQGGAWRGSANQPLVGLTDLGRERYDAVGDEPPERPQFQVAVDDEHIWYIGVPRRGDLERVVARAAARGVEQGALSWRT